MQLKSSESVSPVDTISFGGDKFDRTPERSYGNLLSEIDNKRKRIAYNRNIFNAELANIPKKRRDIMSNIIVNACIMVVVAAICFFISTHAAFGMGMALYYATFIFVIYMFIRIGRYIRLYLINIDCGFSKNYRIKHGVNTFVNEEEYCTSILSSLSIYDEKLDRMEQDITAGTPIDIQAFTAELDRIPDEYDDFKYNAGRLQF